MIVAIIGWVKKSNSVTRDTLHARDAVMKSLSKYPAASTLTGLFDTLLQPLHAPPKFLKALKIQVPCIKKAVPF